MHQQYLAVEQWYLVAAKIVLLAVLYTLHGFIIFDLVGEVGQIIQNGAQFCFFFIKRKKKDKQIETMTYFCN